VTEARTCRVCDVPGMVHLDRDPAEGPTVDPVVECPLCGRTWIAQGTQHLFKIDADGSAEDFEAIAEMIRASWPDETE
jgi:hypothetical protein